MIKDLRPPILDDLGLESAIKWVLEKHVGERGIRYRLVARGDAARVKARAKGPLDFAKVELVLFRVAQEAVINISKHADAKNAFVSLTFGDSGVEMEIEDDGKGFDVQSVSESGRKDDPIGLGLLGMEERLALLDGRLTVWSEPGKGTRIRAFMPIPD